ncbi:MAG: AAA family ATPase [Roseobacter sp.]
MQIAARIEGRIHRLRTKHHCARSLRESAFPNCCLEALFLSQHLEKKYVSSFAPLNTSSLNKQSTSKLLDGPRPNQEPSQISLLSCSYLCHRNLIVSPKQRCIINKANSYYFFYMTQVFLTFQLDPERRELRDRNTLVAFPPRSFDVLCYLIDHRDRMVTKSELLDQFWSSQVSEAALQKAISLMRKAVRCDGKSVVRTYHGLGFRFIPDVLIQSQDGYPSLMGTTRSIQERRLVGVLCLQFETDADLNDSVVEKFLERAGKCVETHQGEALRITLEGFTASFGLSSHYEDAARRAVHCAAALAALAQEYRDIAVKIGIEHGPVELTEGMQGADWRMPSEIERGAVEAVSLAQASEIILTEAARSQLRDEVTCTTVNGGFKLTTTIELQSGVPGRPQKNATEFVGRRAEMAFLDENLATLSQGTGQGVVLSGPAGIGKTRLLNEFLSALDTRRLRQVKVQCLPGLSNSPLAPIRELCHLLFAQAPEDVVQSDVDVALHSEFLGKTPNGNQILASLSEHELKHKSYDLINRMLSAICLETPLVLAFEDIHWIDATSRDCLDSIIQHADAVRLLVVMTTRPIYDPPPSEVIIQLSPLGHRDGLKLLHDINKETRINEELADNLVHRAAGNPFFIEELALALPSGGTRSRELPETVQAVISVRIGALDPAMRAFLYVLAVIGPAARIELVSHLLGQNRDQVDATAVLLRSMGFIQIDPETYSFRHMLIADTAYAMLAFKERQKLHGEIAIYLESDIVKWTPRPETLAWHKQEAGDADTATTYWLKACRDAMQRFAHREGIAFAESGLKLSNSKEIDAPKREIDLQLYLASAMGAIYGYGAENVGEAYDRARCLNKKVRDSRANIRVLVGLWINAWVGGRLSTSLDYAQDLLDVSKAIEDPSLSLQAHASVGQVLMHNGRLTEALGQLTSGLNVISEIPSKTPTTQTACVACASFASWSNCFMGKVSEAKRTLDISSELAHDRENPLALAVHFGLCSQPFMLMGQIEACLDYADRGVAISRKHDFAFWLGTALVTRGWSLGQMGKMDIAFKAFDEGLSVFEGTGAGVQLAQWYGLKAETLLAAGLFNEGVKAAEHALKCAESTGDVHSVPRTHVVAGRLWAELNIPAKAMYHEQMATKKAAEFGMVKSSITLLI